MKSPHKSIKCSSVSIQRVKTVSLPHNRLLKLKYCVKYLCKFLDHIEWFDSHQRYFTFCKTELIAWHFLNAFVQKRWRRIKYRPFFSEWSKSDCLIASLLTEVINGSSSLLEHELLTIFLIICQKKYDIKSFVWIQLSCYSSSIFLENYLTQTILVYDRKRLISWFLKICSVIWLYKRAPSICNFHASFYNKVILYCCEFFCVYEWKWCMWERAGLGGETDRHLAMRPNNQNKNWVLLKPLES